MITKQNLRKNKYGVRIIEELVMDEKKELQWNGVPVMDLAKKFSLWIGALATVGAGLFFMLFADWFLKCTVTWLFFIAVASIGSAVCAFASTMLRRYPAWKYVLQASALLLSLVVLLILILFAKSEFYTVTLVSSKFNIGKKSYPCLDFAPFVMTVTYILLGLGIAFNTASLTCEAIKPSDDD